jgi:hypothetical protein
MRCAPSETLAEDDEAPRQGEEANDERQADEVHRGNLQAALVGVRWRCVGGDS